MTWMAKPTTRQAVSTRIFGVFGTMAGHKGYALGLWCEILQEFCPFGGRNRMTWVKFG